MAGLAGLVKGLHHITLVTSNQEINRRFYTEILGLRRVKLTVNQDDIFHRHLFYGDEKGTTETAITFFEWPSLPRGIVGPSSPHHLSYLISRVDGLPAWKSWLLSHNVPAIGPIQRGEKVSIYLRDPDGVLVEITTRNEEGVSLDYLREVETGSSGAGAITSDMKLVKLDHASPVSSDSQLTSKFLRTLVGLDIFFEHKNSDQEGTSLALIGSQGNPSFLNYLVSPSTPDGHVGRGSIHHIAMAVEEDEDQRKIMRTLEDAGIRNSGIIDRFWFRSLYFRDPDGNLLEVATKKPGYTADEQPEKLGTGLVLPEWLEESRGRIEEALKNLDAENAGSWPPSYETVTSPPETLPAVTSDA